MTTNDDLNARIRATARVLMEFGAREVYVFGSAAKGRLRDDSDVDMAVVGLPPERFFLAMGRAGQAIDRPFDLVDLDEATAFTRYLRDEGELVRVG